MRMGEQLLFDFDFEKIRGFLPRLNSPELRIRYLEYVRKKYYSMVDDQMSVILGNKFKILLGIEKKYWQWVKKIIDSAEKPKSDDQSDSEKFANLLVDATVFNFDYNERALFDFNINRIQEYGSTLSTLNRLIYFAWVNKEFAIRVYDSGLGNEGSR